MCRWCHRRAQELVEPHEQQDCEADELYDDQVAEVDHSEEEVPMSISGDGGDAQGPERNHDVDVADIAGQRLQRWAETVLQLSDDVATARARSPLARCLALLLFHGSEGLLGAWPAAR